MKQGFYQALGVAVYITLVGVFISNANSIFPKLNNFFGPVIFLLLFSTSAMICGLIVFYKPYKLFFAGKKKEAVSSVIYTALYLFLFLLFFLLSMLIFR